MRSNKVGKEIKVETPPNTAKDITCDLLQFFQQVNAMVELGEELQQVGYQKYCHYKLNPFFFEQFWYNNPYYHLPKKKNGQNIENIGVDAILCELTP